MQMFPFARPHGDAHRPGRLFPFHLLDDGCAGAEDHRSQSCQRRAPASRRVPRCPWRRWRATPPGLGVNCSCAVSSSRLTPTGRRAGSPAWARWIIADRSASRSSKVSTTVWHACPLTVAWTATGHGTAAGYSPPGSRRMVDPSMVYRVASKRTAGRAPWAVADSQHLQRSQDLDAHAVRLAWSAAKAGHSRRELTASLPRMIITKQAGLLQMARQVCTREEHRCARPARATACPGRHQPSASRQRAAGRRGRIRRGDQRRGTSPGPGRWCRPADACSVARRPAAPARADRDRTGCRRRSTRAGRLTRGSCRWC